MRRRRRDSVPVGVWVWVVCEWWCVRFFVDDILLHDGGKTIYHNIDVFIYIYIHLSIYPHMCYTTAASILDVVGENKQNLV